MVKKYTICNHIFSKAVGLMFSIKRNLIFEFNHEQKISLHMLFVFFPIWVVYLDKDRKVVEIAKLYPFISFHNPKNEAKYILELVKKPNVKVDDVLDW